ncbi:hypothetical protein GCM10009700_24230 [Brevibacterium sanguinis]|uniref:hypothetical protein n=1 Tax=Brevibacterium sanguinis TaxID=232444 RepID=UPI0031DC0057
MATRAQNIESIEKALGEPWSQTRQRLEKAGGKDASHKELADALYPQFDGLVDNHGWWVQGAVVAYEQEIGRRVPGQRADGTFDVAVSRTVTGQRGDVIDRFAALVDGSLGGVAIAGEPRPSTTAKRSFWRADLADGTKIEAAAEPKDDERTRLTLTASKLPSAEALEEWRAHLKDLVAEV